MYNSSSFLAGRKVMSNPLLAEDGLPAFDAIPPEHSEPAVRAQLEGNRRRLQQPDIAPLLRQFGFAA